MCGIPVSELTSHAAGPGVPGVPNGTSAAGSMQTRLADGVGAAGLHVARVAARALPTLVRVGAVAVRLTARHRRHYRGRGRRQLYAKDSFVTCRYR